MFPSSNDPPLNAIVYADYETIHSLLKSYGRNPLEMNPFNIIQEKLTATGINVIDSIVYGNFNNYLTGRQQTFLRSLGLQTRQIMDTGPSTLVLELTVEALTHLFENPGINVFAIIINALEIIPLLKVIKYQNKLSQLITTQNGFNSAAAQYADAHLFLEDLLELTEPAAKDDPFETLITIDANTVSMLDLGRAREVARYFYKSHIRERAALSGEPVNLKGYLEVVARVVNRHPGEIMNDFKLAHCLKYVTIYQDPERGLCLKEGEKMEMF